MPENKIRIFKQRFKLINFDGNYYGYEMLYPRVYRSQVLEYFWGLNNNANEVICIGFPGDTIALYDWNLDSDEQFIIGEGFCHQYTVSTSHIDDNTTSYSMVSLDEGASSSGGTITEGTVEESGSFKYMLAPITPSEMQIKNAVEHCRDSFDGYTDWRLPSIDELIDALSGGAENSILSDNQVWTRTFDPSMGSQYNGYLRLYLNNFAYVESDNWESNYYNSANTICIRGR